MVLVDQLLQIPHAHRGPPEVVDLGAVLLGLLLLGLEPLLVGDELLLHEQVVLDPLQLEQPELALGERGDGREPGGGLGALLLALLPADAGRRGGRLELLLLLVGAVLLAVAGLAVEAARSALSHGCLGRISGEGFGGGAGRNRGIGREIGGDFNREAGFGNK